MREEGDTNAPTSTRFGLVLWQELLTEVLKMHLKITPHLGLCDIGCDAETVTAKNCFHTKQTV